MRKLFILMSIIASPALLAINLSPRACLTNDYLAFNRWSGGNNLEIVYWINNDVFTRQVKLAEKSDITTEFLCSDKSITVEHVIRNYRNTEYLTTIISIENISSPVIISTVNYVGAIVANSDIEISRDYMNSQEVKKGDYTYRISTEYISSTNCSPKHNVMLTVSNNKGEVLAKQILATFQVESDCE